MICPNCGQSAHRSHSRNFRESFIKRATPYKTFRCRECGWRGFAAPTGIRLPRVNRTTVYIWIIGLLLAVVIGYFGAGTSR